MPPPASRRVLDKLEELRALKQANTNMPVGSLDRIPSVVKKKQHGSWDHSLDCYETDMLLGKIQRTHQKSIASQSKRLIYVIFSETNRQGRQIKRIRDELEPWEGEVKHLSFL